MMESLNFTPYTSVGAIVFGEARDRVRVELGSYKEYKKNKFSSNTLDDFGFCQVFYTSTNIVEAVEMYRNVELLYKNTNLFGLNENKLIALINDSNLVKDEYGLTFPSIGLYITLIEGMPDSILAYTKGYM